MKKKLGAVAGRRSFTCAAMVWSSSETVASSVRPSPSAVTTPVVAAPGRVRLASARRGPGARGRGRRRRSQRSAPAIKRSAMRLAAAPPRNSAANRGDGASTSESAMTANPAAPAAAR